MSKWLEVLNNVLREAKLSRKARKRKKIPVDSHAESKQETIADRFSLNLEHNVLKCKTKNRSRPSGRRLPLRKSRDTLANLEAAVNADKLGQKEVDKFCSAPGQAGQMSKAFRRSRRSSSCNNLCDFENRTSLEVSKLESNISSSYMYLPSGVKGSLDNFKFFKHQEDLQSVYAFLDELRFDLSKFEKYLQSLELLVKENKANRSEESFRSKANLSLLELNRIKINYNLFYYHSAHLIEKLRM